MSFQRSNRAGIGFGIWVNSTPSPADPVGLHRYIVSIMFWTWRTSFGVGKGFGNAHLYYNQGDGKQA